METGSRKHSQKPFLNGEPDWASAFWVSIERVKRTQLRPGSTYCQIRPFVPVVAMALLWAAVTTWVGAPAIHRFLEFSITIRHLLLAIAIVAIWNAWVSFPAPITSHSRGAMMVEVHRLVAASFACGVFLTISNLLRFTYFKGFVLGALLTLALLLVGGGFLVLAFFAAARLLPSLTRGRNALIIGSGPRALRLRSRLRYFHDRYQVYGCLDDQYVGSDPVADKYLGDLSMLEALLKEEPIDAVLIGLPFRSMYDQIQNIITRCERIGVEAHYMKDVFDTTIASPQLHSQEPERFTVLGAFRHSRLQLAKRVFDFAGASVLLVLAAPFMLIAAIAVRLSSPGPIFFVQTRYGLHRQRFSMFKFRTMVTDAEVRQSELEAMNEAQGPVFKISKDPRVTKIGAFLRKTSIDELPQLFNVLKGDMSLVGPRPLPLRDVSKFQEAWLLRRFSVKPGLTCLWQIGGRSNTSFNEWIRQDLEYIDDWSLLLDMRILLKTIPAVFRGSGAV